MKNLKQIFLGAAIALGTITLTVSSCTSDACEGVTCKNGGVCDGGTCTCVAGYNGINCEVRISDKFNGTWKCHDVDNLQNVFDYECTIAGASSNPLFINITNFGDFNSAGSLSVTQNTIDTKKFYLDAPTPYGKYTISNVLGELKGPNQDTLYVTYAAADSVRTTVSTGVWYKK